jgi:hypothetical protein
MINRATQNKAKALLVLIVMNTLSPCFSYALTGGPTQPEVESFEPAGTSQMVDLSSGSFVYNIPLLEVNGYPLNLSYHSGISMDQEASSVGLGWNINPGAVNRNMRGLPDDFNGNGKNGDIVKKVMNIAPNQTYGGSIGLGVELFGLSKAGLSLNASLGASFNNYKGVGFDFGITPSLRAGKIGGSSMTADLGLHASTFGGVTIEPELNFQRVMEQKGSTEEVFKSKIGIGASMNSRQGLKSLNVSANRYNWRVPLSASYSFASPSYVPQVQIPFFNYSLSANLKGGFALWGAHPNANISGYFTEQSLAINAQGARAYGYLYAQDGSKNVLSMMDFNRELDGPFTKHRPNLAIPIPTQDVYGVTGQGIGGSYQLKRSDVGVMYDRKVNNLSMGLNVGGEFGATAVTHGGVNLGINTTNSYSQRWSKDNTILSNLNFVDTLNNDPNYETSYFKSAGERTVESDSNFIKTIGGTEPVRVALKNFPGSLHVRSENTLQSSKGNINITEPIRRKQRDKRNQNISWLSGDEASRYGLETSIKNYTLNSFSGVNFTSIPRVSAYRKPHHISELTTLREDGVRYTYGIPAYNTEQNEVSFGVDGSSADCGTGLVTYNPGVDNSINNPKIPEKYYNKVTTPAYTHSFLLTTIQSPDYVDATGDGCSPDDYGNYTKFNYTKQANEYNWRVPVETNKANFNQGFKTDATDDKANYVHGKKEIWNVHSIESKNQVAYFYYSNRLDGLGVLDENGSKNSSAVNLKLDSIVMYVKPTATSALSEPIKKVFFEYSYDICKNLPNTNGTVAQSGKLTLSKLYFTYGNSNKGKLSPYKFFYGGVTYGTVTNAGINPSYNLKGYDRWGNYKPNPTTTTCNNADSVTNADFPYTIQNKTLTDQYMAAWTMNKIQLPSGGIITVSYESNDYSYVQDKRANQILPIYGLSDNTTAPDPTNANASLLYTTTTGSPNRYLFFKLNRNLAGTPTVLQDSIKNMLFNGKPDSFYVYFKCFVALDGINKYEYVPGYAKIEANTWGVAKSNVALTDYDLAYVKLRAVEPDDNNSATAASLINPITKAALQFTRIHLPKIAFGEPEITASSKEQRIAALSSVSKQLKQFFKGFNTELMKKSYCNKIDLKKSWARLTTQDYTKLGGGCRVKSISMSDEWQTMAGAPNASFFYGQEYFYTKEESLPDGKKKIISSGVASYEPMIGGDENPFKQPIFVKEKNILVPDESYFLEGPKMESLFPGPSVVYSKVMVRNLQRTNVKKNATGFTVSEYYTARDFPTIIKDTGINPQRKKSSVLNSILKIGSKDFMTASQGYAIELNDMHGKPKAQWTFNEIGTRLSGVEYLYKTDPINNKHLDNGATIIMPNGSIQNNAQIGVDYTMIADAREAVTNTNSFTTSGNLEFFFALIFPAAVPIILPGFSNEKTQFRSIATTKVIQRYGLLDKVRAYEDGATIETQNTAYDAETGDVLVTKSQNEFNDAHYNFTYPAHWAYEGMQAAYKNIGATFKGSFAYNTTTGLLTLPVGTDMNFFAFGDEVSCFSTGTYTKAWVIDIDKVNRTIKLVNAAGAFLTNTTYSVIKNLRSGRRNTQATPIASLKAKSPIIVANALSFQNVLEASGTEFSDSWQPAGEINYYNKVYQVPSLANLYNVGAKGIWRPLRSWSYLVNRKSTANVSQSSDLRNDGVFNTFNTFWKTPAGANPLWTIDSTNWTWSKKNTKIDGYGNQLESVDALGRYDTRVMGYNNTLVTAIADNAKYNQISMDSYEDSEAQLTQVRSYNYATLVSPTNRFPAKIDSWKINNTVFSTVGNIATPAALVDSMNLWDGGTYWTLNTTTFSITGGKAGNKYSPMVWSKNSLVIATLNVNTSTNLIGTIDKPNTIGPWVTTNVGIGVMLKTNTFAHSGRYAIKFNTNDTTSIGDLIEPNYSSAGNVQYRKGIQLSPGKYIVSLWVKENLSNMSNVVKYDNTYVEIATTAGVTQLRPTGNILDGWQRIFGEFTIPVGSIANTIRFVGTQNSYFDDLRLHPFNTNMKSFVYDPFTLRLTAELDENNYPTYYEYDKAGNLTHVKKVTEKGVQTVKEVRAGSIKTFIPDES